MSHLTLTLLGTFQAHLDGAPLTNFHSVKVQGLLAYLALEATRPHTREALMALFWPDDAPQSAQQSLRQALYTLRRTLGDTDNPTHEPFLLVTRQTVQINPTAAYTLDVATFLQQVQQGHLEQAAALYQAELLTGLTTDSAPFEEWLRSTRQYLHNLALSALKQLTQQQLDCGDYLQAALYARRQLALEPWREEAHRQVMISLAYNGDRSAALAQYESCRRVLVDELGVEPAAETMALYEQIRSGQLRGQPARANPLPASPSVGEEPLAIRHNLPPQPTPFIGRKADLEQITTRLDDPTCRLLTIVGPGGMGKTRLAIAAAQSILEGEPPVDNLKSKIANPKFEDGIFFVGLAGVGSPDLLVSTIAAALDFTFYGNGAPKTQLLNYLRAKALLLVLDNCEHLLDGIDLVAELLAAAPRLKVLATSREPLNLREEWLQPLAGLSFPADNKDPALLASYTAVQLFAQRARRMKPAFDLASEGPAVARICQLVNGMPLGIEMAAAWLKFYGCTQIAQEIARSLDFLATSLRNVPVRHRSMRAVFAHSWSLLGAEEQSVFAQLAVFRGGFTQEAAEAAVGASMSLLLGLVEKSLLQLTPTNRFQLHELLRQFGEEKLQTQPHTWAATHDHHCRYYTTLLQRHEAPLKGPKQQATRLALEAEIENIRAAWQFEVAQQKVDELDQAVECLNTLYQIKSWYTEAAAVFEQTATALVMDEPVGKQGILVGKVLVRQAGMLSQILTLVGGSTSWEKVEAIYHQSLTILRQLNVPEEIALALSGLSARCWITGEFEQSLHLNQQALTLFAEQDNRWEMSRVLTELGIIYYCVGAYRQAIDCCRQALTLCEAIGEPCHLSESWRVLANFHLAAGEYAEARQAAQTALTIATSIDYKLTIAWARQVLGDLAWRMNEYALAQQHAQASITVSQEIGLTRLQGAALSILGNVAYSLGDYLEARTYFYTVLAANAASGLNSAWLIADAVIGMATVLVKQGQPVQGIEILSHVLNTDSILYEAKDRAQRLLAEFATELPPEIVAAGQARRQGRDLMVAVAELLMEANIQR